MKIPNKIEIHDRADCLENIDYLADTLNALIDTVTAQQAQIDKLSTPEEKPWPQIDDEYFWISHMGKIQKGTWDNYDFENDTRDFLGIYKTREEAEARILAVKNLRK